MLDPDAAFCSACGARQHLDETLFDISDVRDQEAELDGTIKAAMHRDGVADMKADPAGASTLHPSHLHGALTDDDVLDNAPGCAQTSVSETQAPRPAPAPQADEMQVKVDWRQWPQRLPANPIPGPPRRSPPRRMSSPMPASKPEQPAPAGAGGAAARALRVATAEAAAQVQMLGQATQTEGRSGAGRMPARPAEATHAEALREEALGPQPIIDWCLPQSDNAPYLPAALKFIRAGQLDQAFQCVFRHGNESTLMGVLSRLRADDTWPDLPEPDARYLAHLLSMVVCKDPLAAASNAGCHWLNTLAQMPGGTRIFSEDDMPGLQAALFSLSGAAGKAGALASTLYYKLFRTPGV